MRRWRAVIGVGASLLAGCGPQLDIFRDVEDLRVLAIRAEPPEVLDSPLPTEVTFEALVVDPRHPDEPIDLTWELCPVESNRACYNYGDRIAAAYENLEALADLVDGAPAGPGGGPGGCTLSPEVLQGFGRFTQLVGDLTNRDYLDRYRAPMDAPRLVLGVPPPDETGDGDLNARTADLAFLRPMADELAACGVPVPSEAELDALPTDATDLHIFHLLTNPLQSLLGAWPSVVLTARGVDDVVVAQKRLVVGWRRPSGSLAVFRLFAPDLDLGVPVCPPGATTGGCLAADERVPNHNPVFADVEVGTGSATDAEYRSLRTTVDPDPLELEVLELRPRQSVRIRPVFTEDSFEPYQVVRVDPTTAELSVTDEVEEISVTWFATGGSLAETRTWPTFTVGYDTRYTAPPLPPPSFGRDVRLWMVARDQRGGTTWQELRIRIVDPEE